MTMMGKQQDGTKSTLADSFGRRISYLRLSVTDRCDFRCRYCMSERMQFLPKREILTLEELAELADAFIERGIKSGLPANYEWVAALGLVVTLVWLYLEILRLLSYLRN